MNAQQNFLIIAWLFVTFMIWQIWEQDKWKYLKQTKQTISVTKNNNIHNLLINRKGKRIIAKTDTLELIINTYGGDIEQALLLTYQKELKSKKPFQLLKTTSEFTYQAQSGLTGYNGPDNPENGPRPFYEVNRDIFILADKKNELVIPMIYKDHAGNIFKKNFTLKRGEYTVNVDYSIQNTTKNPIEISIFGQLKQSIKLPSDHDTKDSNFMFSLHTFRGAAYSTLEKKYEKCKLNTIVNAENLHISSKGIWIAMLQQYFTTAWIPCNFGENNIYVKNLGNDIVAIGYKSQPIFIQSGQTKKLQSTLWIGPSIQDKMAIIAPNLDLTVDYGWLWFISQPLFKLLKFIYSFLGNWGFSIIFITFFIRTIMYPLTKTQYSSMAKMRILQPKIQEIRRRLGNDKQRISQEMINLYKEAQVNPLGGCFPLLIQMPIFLALYYMLIGSVELRHAPFVFWIYDLSAKDPYYVLPILMGITMYIIQTISPSTANDPMQQKIMHFMPVIFTIFFLWFPSGLVLYYIVSNLVTIIQQKIIYRSIKKCEIHN